jgi:hypothetical protein
MRVRRDDERHDNHHHHRPESHDARVHLDYDQTAVDVIKTMPSPVWLADERLWSMPRHVIDEVAAGFIEAGFEVTVGGQPVLDHLEP